MRTKENISFRRFLIDLIPNSSNDIKKNCMAASRENYLGVLLEQIQATKKTVQCFTPHILIIHIFMQIKMQNLH